MTNHAIIECCVRCMTGIYRSDELMHIERFGRQWGACKDLEKCATQQEQARARHQDEIARRLRGGKGRHTHLIVIQDRLGHEFGYGNYYVAVKPGEDPDEIARRKIAEADAKGPESDRDMLVVEKNVAIEGNNP